ncbi:MAG: hypothetical protein IJ139_04975 [Bacteroidaceae bacterium]|nr:hypothetical protein [Bacteroidaceae bacterium]
MSKRISLIALLVAIITSVRAQDMTDTPLTFEAVEAGTVSIINPNALTIEYSQNGGGWTAVNTNPISIAVAAGDQVCFRGDNAAYGKFDMMYGESYTRFTATNDVYVYGNVMSLISSTGYPALKTLEKVGGSDEYAMDINLAFLFSTPEDDSNWAPINNTTIKNHPTKDIVLPATNVTRSGYMYMFAGCQGLTRAPELPATDLSRGCYHRMFDSCTSLEKAPVLAAATVPEAAYSCMFAGCSKLSYVKCMATDISDIDCTGGWLTGVATEGIFIKAEGMNDWTVGPQGKWNEVDGIPAGWAMSSETPLTLEAIVAGTINIVNPKGLTIEWSKDGASWTATNANPISISVTTGDKVQLRGNNACYGNDASGMPTHITATNDVYVYGNIMSLVHKDDFASNNTLTSDFAFAELFCSDDYANTANTTIKSHPTKELLLPATSLPMGAYMYMFAKCQGLTRAPELPAMTLGPTCYHRMFGDCTALTAAPKLPATTLADECYFSMFDGCTALTTAPELPATTLAGGCYSEMFAHCTALTKAPVLPATTLADNCYEGMFNGCSSLNYVKCLATDLGTKFGDFYTSTHNWLDGVSTTGTFVMATGMEGWLTATANGIPTGWTVKEGTNYDPVKNPLTIEVTEDATAVTISNPLRLFISYDTYDSAGNLLSSTSSSFTTITIDGLNAGDCVKLFGDNASYSDGTVSGSTIISFDKDCYVYGNIMSLVNSSSFAEVKTLTDNYTFYDLFDSNSHLKSHSTNDLVLTATTLTEGCYSNMFYKCTALTKAPDLPATTLAPMCYKSMFSGCSALTEAPVLPAMTMATESYARMFFNCKALTTAPQLPATTMANYCYSFMFYGCNVLTTAPALPALTMAPYCYENMFGFCHELTATPVLPATTLANYCYYRMFLGCNGLTTITSLPATVMAPYCYNEMFRQCQALTTGPTLPATTMAEYCYRCMFQACTSLTSPPELPATTLAKGCYLGMFVNTALTAAPELPATTLAESCYYQMFQNCQQLESYSTLPAAILPQTCYLKMFADCPKLVSAGEVAATTVGASSCEYMFMNCTALETAPALPATTLAIASYNYMFSGCTNLVNAPVLPATTLAEQCYQRMFEECHSLVTAPELPATNLADLCYNDMFWNCTSLKNAPVLPAVKLADYCYTMMFLGCSSLEKAPDLIAAKLAPGCYEHMFWNCTSLNYVKCLATDLGDETCTDGWLTNVATTGTFVQAPGADWSGKGTTEGTDFDDPSLPVTFVHGIPATWTTETASAIYLAANADGEGKFWATFYSDDSYTVDENTTIYTAKVSGDQTKVELTEVADKNIPAGNAVILISSSEAIMLTYNTEITATLADNDLQGSATDIATPANTYMLVKGNSGVGFYHWKGATIPANRGFITLSGSAAAARPFLNIDTNFDEITGIRIIDNEQSTNDDSAIYDLTGRRLLDVPTQGVYIKNGKKVLVK